jgi:hypothetical protein
VQTTKLIAAIFGIKTVIRYNISSEIHLHTAELTGRLEKVVLIGRISQLPRFSRGRYLCLKSCKNGVFQPTHIEAWTKYGL